MEIDYAKDNKPTNQSCPRCGNPTQVHANVGRGKGRVFCGHCEWNDTRPRSPEAPVSNPRDPRQGVKIISATSGSREPGPVTILRKP